MELSAAPRYGVRTRTKAWVRSALPLAVRKAAAAWVGRQEWLSSRHWWSMELVRDLAERDPNEFHRFLWNHHLAYAETYEIPLRFGPHRVHPSRHLFFTELLRALRLIQVEPTEVRSVHEVGCSMGYLLRHLETEVLPRAAVLRGLDVDRYAVERGAAHLRRLGSRVQLTCADMRELRRVLDGQRFDLVFCAGVLMYLDEANAAATVRAMAAHTSQLLAIAGLAHPRVDNAYLPRSEVRQRDGTLIHNLDRMVSLAGGRVVHRVWGGERMVGGNTIYFVFAQPGGTAAPDVHAPS